MVNARYRIEGVLGVGGSAAVSKAFDAHAGRDVAMKRVAADKLPSAKDVQRAQSLLEREYYVLAELAHPKIIEVYDYGVDDDGPYYTMEWLRGATLRQRAPLPPGPACSLIRDIASSLAILHSRRLVHRDVTLHNIHCAEDGTAKLIDFGAMTPIGIPKLVVGTPPFMAPECIDYQIVDGRTDLFSLGACLYYALTGRHAYPARSIKELQELWKYPVVWPSRFSPDVPESLDRLVLELLSLKPAGRPASAAEVFERLTSIASLDSGEAPAVAHAYLATPALAGRRDKLVPIVRRALRAIRGKGSAVVIAGAPGVGRSRLLAAAMLEAKIAGFSVLSSGAVAGSGAPFAVMHAVIRALAETEPEAAAAFATRADLAANAGERRGRAVELLAEGLRELSRTRPLAIAVDDLHLVDEESLATLALLSTATVGCRLLLLTTVDTEKIRPNDAALSLILSSSKRIELSTFSAPETRALLSSLFGEVPNLDVLAEIAHTMTQGNARELLDGAQALVDLGLAQYAGGAWIIGSDPDALARALTQGTDVVRRIDGISFDARALLSVLALDRDAILSLVDYPDIAFAGDRARAHHALTALLEAGLVTLLDDRCRFTRESHRTFVVSALSLADKRALHERLAAHTARVANPIYAAHHYFHAGRFELAGDALNRFRDFVDAHPEEPVVRAPVVLDTVEAMVASDQYGRAFRAEHGAGFVINAVYRGLPERAAPHVAHFLRELSWLTALEDFHARTDVEPPARLGMAFALAQERCEGTPGVNPVGALRRLCQLGTLATICARFMCDPSLLGAIPDLSPFAVLSPAVGLTIRLIDAFSMAVRGRYWKARAAISSIYEDLRGFIGEGIDPLTRMALETSSLGQLCSLEAEYAVRETLPHVDALAAFMPNLAESCRARYYLACGMTESSEAARRNCERLSVQSGGLLETRVSELVPYLNLYAIFDDVLGLKRTLSAMTTVLATRPGWKQRVHLAKAHVARCRGKYGAGLAEVEAALAGSSPGDADWALLAALHVTLLELSGAVERAVDDGKRYLDAALRNDLPTSGIALSLSLASARAGDHGEAERHVTFAEAALSAEGASGIHLGWCSEVGARIASLRGDRALFQQRAERCARLYRHGENPTLTARFDALIRKGWSGVRETPGLEVLDGLDATTEDPETYVEAPSTGITESGNVAVESRRTNVEPQ
ncbi:MAG TPA: protein kinase [Polyangiaceae bacterium]|jgi:serine/threonine-protein kinase|nr:protein kinase [Polyangiaceae bacterium]